MVGMNCFIKMRPTIHHSLSDEKVIVVLGSGNMGIFHTWLQYLSLPLVRIIQSASNE